MTYDPLHAEKDWRHQALDTTRRRRISSEKHRFPHRLIHRALVDELMTCGCVAGASVLDIGCGSGEDARYISAVTGNITGIDVADDAARGFQARGYHAVVANAGKLPFPDGSFDFVVCPAVLHHLVGQGGLQGYLREFARVVRPGGAVIAMEPNVFHPSGLLMNIANSIRPGITGLVPHERSLSPLYLKRVFSGAGLEDVTCVAASFTWNRMPLWFSRMAARMEKSFRRKGPFRYLGWFTVVSGRKP